MIYFDGTTKSLLPRAEDLPIQEETAIARLLIGYESQLETPGQQIHSEDLWQAHALFEHALHTKGLTQERAHLAAALYYPLQLWSDLIAVLQQYLECGPSLYEQLWARWCIIDSLAMQRNYQMVIQQQQALLAWATPLIPADHQLCIMNDTTQALCWLMAGQHPQWLRILSELLLRVVPTSHNREDRFLAVRTIVYLLDYAHQPEEAGRWLQQLYAIAQEESASQTELILEADALHIKLATANNDRQAIHFIATQAHERIQQWIQSSSNLTLEQRRDIRKISHNIGSSLYQIHEYALAINFLQLAIQYGSIPYHSYLWLAGAQWKTGASKQQVFALLKQASEHDASPNLQQKIWELSEFQDPALQEDKEFLALCRHSSGSSAL